MGRPVDPWGNCNDHIRQVQRLDKALRRKNLRFGKIYGVDTLERYRTVHNPVEEPESRREHHFAAKFGNAKGRRKAGLIEAPWKRLTLKSYPPVRRKSDRLDAPRQTRNLT